MVGLALKLGLFFGVALAVLTVCGFWAARLLLPRRLQRFTLLASPLLGWCVLAVAASWLNSTVLGMRTATPVILLAAVAADAAVVWRLGWPRWRAQELGVPAALAVAGHALASLPQLLANADPFAAMQLDLHIFLPLAEYLKAGPVGGELVALPNPLLERLNTVDVRGGSGWGFNWVEAAVEVVLGWTSLYGLRPLLATCFALGPAGVYLAARAAFGAGRLAAALAAGWVLNAGALWMVGTGYAGHAASFFLLPLALTGVLVAAAQPSPRTGLLAGLALAGMLLTYYTGAVTVWAVVAGPAVAVVAWRRRAQWRRLAVAAGVAVGSVAVPGGVAHLRLLPVLGVYQSGRISVGAGDTTIIPPAQVLGLALDEAVLMARSSQPLLEGGALVAAKLAGLVLLAAAGGGVVAAVLSRGWGWGRWAAALAGWAGLLLVLGPVGQYPYGYLKAASLGGFVAAIGVAQAAALAWRRDPRLGGVPRLLRRAWRRGRATVGPAGDGGGRWLAAAGVALAAGLLALNLATTVRYYLVPTNQFYGNLTQVRALTDPVPPGASVALLADDRIERFPAAMYSYLLMSGPVVVFDPAAPAATDYLLVLTRRLAPPAVAAMTPVAENDGGALYRLGR